MKNGLIVWNVVLTLIAGYLLINQFSGKKVAGTTKKNDSDTLKVNGNFRIAYFEMDSIEANFAMVKDVKSELSKKEDGINIELDRLGKNYQDKLMGYQNKQKDMTQQEYEAAALDLKKMEQNISSRKQQLDQDYTEFVTRRMKDVKTKIEEYLKEYNKTHNFSYIVSYEQGLFYYKDTAYNITTDLVRGLNDQYKPAKKQ